MTGKEDVGFFFLIVIMLVDKMKSVLRYQGIDLPHPWQNVNRIQL